MHEWDAGVNMPPLAVLHDTCTTQHEVTASWEAAHACDDSSTDETAWRSSRWRPTVLASIHTRLPL